LLNERVYKSSLQTRQEDIFTVELSPRTVLINLRVSQDFKAAAERAAKADNRSLTGFIEKLVLDHLEATAKRGKR